MQEKFKKLTNDISEKWQGLNKQQQMRLALGVIGLIIAISTTIFIITRPTMVPLYTNRDFSTISEIQMSLDEAGIRNNVIQNGRGIEVRQEDYAAARLQIEGRTDIFVDDSFLFTDMLENTGMSTSDATRREMSRAAQEGQIEVMLRQVEGISDATVILNTPDNTSLFLRDSQIPTATVFLVTSINIDNQMAHTIASSVASSVEGLTVENITILNQHGQTIFDGNTLDEEVVGANLDLERQRRNEIENTAFMLLNPMFDEVRIMSHIVINQDVAVQESRTVTNPLGDDSNTGLVVSERTLSESAMGSPAGNIEPGLGANDGAVPVFGMGGAMETEATREEADRTFTYNEIIEQRQLATGYVLTDDSSMAIMVYNYTIFDQSALANSGQLDDITWEEFVEENSNPIEIEIDENLVEALMIGSGINNLTIIGYELPIFIDATPQPINWYGILLFVILAAFIAMLAYGLIRRTQQEEVVEVEPELSVEDLLVSTRIEEEKAAAEEEAERLKAINYSMESEVKTQIEKFVDEKPEAVAQLLRSWINDGWE